MEWVQCEYGEEAEVLEEGMYIYAVRSHTANPCTVTSAFWEV